MPATYIVWLGLGAILTVLAALAVGPRMLARPDRGGDPRQGLAVLCGGLRWLGVRWGRRSVPAGLRRAGFAGKFIYWPWHSGLEGWLVLPALLNRDRAERRARRLAVFLARRHRAIPDRPIWLLGVSAGGFQALRALELLPPEARVRSAALLSAAVDPGRNLAAGLSHLDGPLVSSSSALDFVVLGLGTLIFGTADRKHAAAAGMVGVRAGGDRRLVELRWRPAMILSGRWGGHATCTPPAYIARYVAPAIRIGNRPGERYNQ